MLPNCSDAKRRSLPRAVLMALWLGIAVLLASVPLYANNITVSNTRLVGQNAGDGSVMIQFDLSWKNSWRVPLTSGINNWDAAWVFVKWRVPVSVGGDGLWKHVRLNNSGHTAGTGMTVETGLLTPGTTYDATTNPALGVFIYRSEPGRGDINLTGVQLVWDYSAAGLSETALLEVQVFAIEMVYVPQGSFFVGSGGLESGSFTNGSWVSGATIPLRITSEDALAIGPNPGNLWGTSSSGNNTIGGAGTLPAAYPKGFNAFYSMKYSISQQQYVDFINTLTTRQNEKRAVTIATNRSGISVSSGGVYSTTNPFVAHNFISWMDGAAYMDWAGLRPMTELEFEKAARGPLNPAANDYAWGTATIAALPYTLSNAGAENEAIATNYSLTAGNAMYSSTVGSIGGPVRVGIFGTTASTRVQSGASLWGIMELSGNLWERSVTVGNPQGRAFTGLHGDGTLWPPDTPM
jgi:formylglycine-generating enzyme required for sulfatase activity